MVPRNIDTLRDSECAVCGSVGTMNGDRCTVCGYMATPQAFQSPDTSLAPKVRDELGIGNPDGDDALGAPDSGLEGPPGAEDDLEGMGEGEQGPGGLEGDEDIPDLVCDNCGATFDSQEEEEDLSEPYLSPAARIEPDVSALGVQDDMEVAREVAQEENQAGTTEGVARQEGEECPVCGIGTLVINTEPVPEEGEEGLPGEEPGPNELGGDAVGGVPEDEEGLPDEEVPPGQEDPPGQEEGPDEEGQAPPGQEGEVVPPEQDEEPEEPGPEDQDEDEEEDEDGPPFGRRQRKESSTMAVPTGARPPVPRGRQANPPRRQATAAAPNPAALERRRLFQALEATTASLNRQADLLQAQDRKLNTVGNFIRQASTKILRTEPAEPDSGASDGPGGQRLRSG